MFLETEKIDGIDYLHYVRASLQSDVVDLYVLESNPSIVYKAIFYDGTIWMFSNVCL